MDYNMSLNKIKNVKLLPKKETYFQKCTKNKQTQHLTILKSNQNNAKSNSNLIKIF